MKKDALENRCKLLTTIVKNTIWMARRYAHKRSSYATSMLNESIDTALALGVEIEDDVHIGRYADDGMFGTWDPSTGRWVKR